MPFEREEIKIALRRNRTLKDSFEKSIEYVPADRKGREIVIFPVLFMRFSNINIILIGVFCFVFWIKLGKTKQKIVALVATTLKTLFAVTKSNGRFSWRKLNTRNIYDLFLNVLVHISPISI